MPRSENKYDPDPSTYRPPTNKDGTPIERREPVVTLFNFKQDRSRGTQKRFGRVRMPRLGPGGRKMDDWEWNPTAVPAPRKRNRNRLRNKIARQSRKRNRATTQ